MDLWIKMQETFFLAGNRAVNTLTFISNVGCQIHPPGLETSEWHWLGSEQTSRPYNYGRPAACMWERKRDGPEDTRLFSGMFSLSCAFWPGHCPLRAGAAGIKRWIALSLEESRMLICPYRGMDSTGANVHWQLDKEETAMVQIVADEQST